MESIHKKSCVYICMCFWLFCVDDENEAIFSSFIFRLKIKCVVDGLNGVALWAVTKQKSGGLMVV
jgi:hypothetical protein